MSTEINNLNDIPPFTKTEYVPGYMCMESFNITYDLKNRTITVDGRTKKMSDYYYNRALAYVRMGEV